jgi:hypothetical protein
MAGVTALQSMTENWKGTFSSDESTTAAVEIVMYQTGQGLRGQFYSCDDAFGTDQGSWQVTLHTHRTRSVNFGTGVLGRWIIFHPALKSRLESSTNRKAASPH